MIQAGVPPAPPHPQDAPGSGDRVRSAGWASAWIILGAVPLVFLAIFFVWPVASIVARGLVPDGTLDLGGFADVFSRPRTWRIVGNTLTLAVLGTVFSVLLGLPGAHVLYRRSFPGRRVVRALVTVPFVMPTVVVGVAFGSLLSPDGALGFLGLDGTLTAIVAASVFFNYSVIVRTVGGMWAHLDDRPEQAARSLGASPWRAFVSVTLPALTPAIAGGAAVVFLYCASAFGIVLVLGGRSFGTLETEIYLQTTQYLDLRAAAVLSITQMVVIVAALRVAAAARVRRERALRLSGDVDRGPSQALPLGRGDAPAAAVTASVVVGLLILPMAALVVRSLRTPDGWGLAHYVALSGTGTGNALAVPVTQAVMNSLRIAVDATVIAVLMGSAVALVLSRRPQRAAGRRALEALDHVFMLPLGVSAVTVGFGFLVTLNRPPLDLRSSAILIPIAQAVVAIPLVIRTLLPVLRAIDQRLREAASVRGAGPARVFAVIDAPVLGRSLGLAVGFAFAISLGEFGATSFLARPDRPTLPVVIYRLLGRPGPENIGMAMAASVVLALVTTGVMALAERVRVGSAGEL